MRYEITLEFNQYVEDELGITFGYDDSGTMYADYEKIVAINHDVFDEICQNTLGLNHEEAFPKPDLRIFDFISEYADPFKTDFTILGLVKKTPSYVRGRKISATYENISSEEVVVQKTFDDVYDDVVLVPGTSAVEVMVGINVLFEWLNNDGSVGASKESFIPLNIGQVGELTKKRRDRAITWLQAESKSTPAEPLVDALYDHYTVEIHSFIDKGDDLFEVAINNETDPTILAHLSVVADLQGNTIKDIILNQISQ